MGLKKGAQTPKFFLPDQDGKLFESSEVVGSKPLVLFFYPKDYTPGCTKQVCSFRDHYEDFQELGAEVVGISSDSEKQHSRFSKSYNLPFRLLSDKDNRVRKLFEVEGSLFNLLPGRETFVINSSGIIQMSFNSMDPGGHIKKALKALKEQQIS